MLASAPLYEANSPQGIFCTTSLRILCVLVALATPFASTLPMHSLKAFTNTEATPIWPLFQTVCSVSTDVSCVLYSSLLPLYSHRHDASPSSRSFLCAFLVIFFRGEAFWIRQRRKCLCFSF